MSLASSLTIILPVYGRVNYTLRWLQWIEASGMKCRVIVADGSSPSDAAKAARAVEVGAAKGLPWSHKIPEPKRASVWIRAADAAAEVKTPYAVQAANDDFPLAEGLVACVAALDAHPDAAACGGPTTAFALTTDEPVWSPHGRAKTPVVRAPLHGATPAARVEALFSAYDPLWYDVQRASVMRDAILRVERTGIGNMNLCEILHSVGVAAAGPVLRVPENHLARQEDSVDSASAEIMDRGDLLTEILTEGWGKQFDAFIAAAAEATGGTSANATVRSAYTSYARATLARTPGFAGPLPLRRRVAAKVKSALGGKTVAALRRLRASAQASVPAGAPASADLKAMLAFLAAGPK